MLGVRSLLLDVAVVFEVVVVVVVDVVFVVFCLLNKIRSLEVGLSS